MIFEYDFISIPKGAYMKKSNGKLTIRAYAASEAIPIEGVNITVRGSDELSADTIYNLITDIDGITETLILPTPAIDYSLIPSSAEIPYSTYDLIAKKDGYQTKEITNIIIFAEREAILPINMIPTNDMLTPKGNAYALITENESL